MWARASMGVFGVACSADAPGHLGPSPEPPDGAPSETGSPGTTADTGPATPVRTFDCTTVPDAPLSVRQLGAPRGYHDVVFDTEGHLIGSDGTSLLKVDSNDVTSVFAANTRLVEGMDRLPDGDLVVADSGTESLMRFGPNGGRSPLATNIRAYGVEVGPDGRVYAASWLGVYRVDPEVGEQPLCLDQEAQIANFSPDLRYLYVANSTGGRIFAWPLDEDLEVEGPRRDFAAVSVSHIDGLGVDLCGNVYATGFDPWVLYRITPDGTTELYYDFGGNRYFGHGLEWGSGIGAWKDTAIYLPQPYNGNQVLEIDIGVPSREWDGVAIGL